MMKGKGGGDGMWEIDGGWVVWKGGDGNPFPPHPPNSIGQIFYIFIYVFCGFRQPHPVRFAKFAKDNTHST